MSLLAAVAGLALGHAQIDPNIVVWRTYKAGAHSQAVDQRIIEISTLGDYQRYVNTYGPQGVGDGKDVEWGKEELVAIHAGPRNTGGYSVEVDRIVKVKPTESCVYWKELTPVKGVATTQVMTSPWTIVRITRNGTHLTFNSHVEEGRLPGGIKIISIPGYDWGCNCCTACVREHEFRLPWRVYAAGDDAPILTPSTCVMSSAGDYERYVKNYSMGGLGDGSNIDWNRERLLAIHLGRRFSPGYQIVINHVDIVDPTRVDVSYYQVEPCGLSLTVGGSGPYMVIRIPRACAVVTCTKKVVRDDQPYRVDSCDCGCETCRYCGRRGG
jgi:hypothetical protein